MLTNESDTSSEHSLWNDFLSGDDKVYAYFYKKYVYDLFSYGMKFTTDREIVKDCIQDVFVKIYSNRAKLGNTDNVRLYLFIALKNTLINFFQKDKDSFFTELNEPIYASEYTIEDKIINDEVEQEKNNKMIRILDLLTPRQKEVIYYRYVEDMSIDDICNIMEMNYQSVLNLIQRSLKRVKKVLLEKKETQLNLKSKYGNL